MTTTTAGLTSIDRRGPKQMAITQAERDKVPAADFAGPDQSFPITDQASVHDAARLIGHADNPAEVKARIIAIAKRKGFSLPDAWMGEGGMMKSGDYMITLGPAVKAMGGGKVSGYLVQWGNEATKDADGEWFTAETDFDQEFPARASVYYHHGQDPAVGRQRLTHGKMERDEFGVRIDAQLDLTNTKQAAIYRRVERGEMGWSSGSLGHVTIPPRESPGGPIFQWPLGHDASLTHIPSDRRNAAVAVKSTALPPVEELAADDGPTISLNEAIERLTDHTERVLGDVRRHAVKAGRKLSNARRERLLRLRDELNAMLDETAPLDAADASTGATSPVMGDGATEERVNVGATVPMSEADLHDLYLAAVRQHDAAAYHGGP